MLYPYMTLADETEIVHSEMDADSRWLATFGSASYYC